VFGVNKGEEEKNVKEWKRKKNELDVFFSASDCVNNQMVKSMYKKMRFSPSPSPSSTSSFYIFLSCSPDLLN